MKNFVIMADMKPYTVKVQFVVVAKEWADVIAKHPEAELVRIA